MNHHQSLNYSHQSELDQMKQEQNRLVTSIAPTLSPQNTLLLLGPDNTVTACPFCLASIRTAIKHTNNTRTHIAAALWCWVCLCCIPYLVDSAKNTDHYCPNCHRSLDDRVELRG